MLHGCRLVRAVRVSRAASRRAGRPDRASRIVPACAPRSSRAGSAARRRRDPRSRGRGCRSREDDARAHRSPNHRPRPCARPRRLRPGRARRARRHGAARARRELAALARAAAHGRRPRRRARRRRDHEPEGTEARRRVGLDGRARRRWRRRSRSSLAPIGFRRVRQRRSSPAPRHWLACSRHSPTMRRRPRSPTRRGRPSPGSP